MSASLKWSPLCSRNDGREVFFTAKVSERKLSIVFPQSFLDDVCGAQANEKDRKSWVKKHREDIVPTLTGSQQLPVNLTPVLIEEIS